MEITSESTASAPRVEPRPWDARLGRRLVTPLKDSWVTPNHLTTLRLGVGLGAAAAFTRGSYGWSNLAALLVILSNFLDHTDGELARVSGKTSRIGHLYDIASDAAVTILIFIAIGAGVAADGNSDTSISCALSGHRAAAAALLFSVHVDRSHRQRDLDRVARGALVAAGGAQSCAGARARRPRAARADAASRARRRPRSSSPLRRSRW